MFLYLTFYFNVVLFGWLGILFWFWLKVVGLGFTEVKAQGGC